MTSIYYENADVTIYLGDCREVLPSIDATELAAVVADPPYAETTLEWDRWPDGWVDAVAATVPVSASLWCFGSFRMFLDRAADFGAWSFAQDVVWEKHNGSAAAADRFRRVHEHAVQWYRGPWADVHHEPVTTPDATARQVRRKGKPVHWGEMGDGHYVSEDGGPRLARSVLYVRSCHGHAVHPTQKPVGILDPLIRYSVPLGGVVLDPMMGVGSTLIAARDAGRCAIGIEAREDYCELAVKRLLTPSQIVLGAAT